MDLVHISNWRSGHNFIQNNIKSWKTFDTVFEIENVGPKDFDIYCQKRKFKISENKLIIINTRDLLNWFASTYMFGFKPYMAARKIAFREQDPRRLFDYYSKKYEDDPYLIERLISWKEITEEVFGGTNYIKDKISISYERFKNEKEYREGICNKIGGEYNEDHLERVPRNGAHSTWDHKDFQFNGSQMKTEERFLKILETDQAENWKKILSKAPEVLDTYEKYFELSNQQKEIVSEIRELKK